MKPPLLIITRTLPTICPACGCQDLERDDRGGWWKVRCRRGDARVCTWEAKYDLQPQHNPLETIGGRHV